MIAAQNTVTWISFDLRLSVLSPYFPRVGSVLLGVDQISYEALKVPARRYAYTLQLMLKKSKKRKSTHSRSPTASRFPPQSQASLSERTQAGSSSRLGQHEPVSPTYERSYSHHDNTQGSQASMNVTPQFNADAANLDQIWRGFEGSSNEQLPIWLTDQTLGGNSITQYGLEAFMMPAEYDQRNQFTTPQIW